MPAISAKNLTNKTWTLVDDDGLEVSIRCRTTGEVLVAVGDSAPSLGTDDHLIISHAIGGVRLSDPIEGQASSAKVWARARDADVTVEVVTGLKFERLV